MCVISRTFKTAFLRGTQYLILDRDTKYSPEFCAALVRDGLHLIRLPPRSPNLNVFAERFVRSIKSECLNRMILFGRDSLQHAISQLISHYHSERHHQGLGHRLLQPAAAMEKRHSAIKRRERLGGMLSYYHRAAERNDEQNFGNRASIIDLTLVAPEAAREDQQPED